MVRTQVLLTEKHRHYLKRLSRRTGESLSSIVRRSLDRMMPPEPPDADLRKRALALVGAFHDKEGKTDVAENHDKYWADSILE